MEEPKVAPKLLITYDDFSKLDLRVARILSAEPVPGASKLLKLRISLGSEERTLAAGIAEYYAPEELVGRKIVVVANLAPRVIRGVESQGMLLAAFSEDETALAFLTPEKESISEGSEVG